MDFLQSTLEEIIESERLMPLAGEQRYGKYCTHARVCSVFLSRCVTGVTHDRMMFGCFFSLLKKHHMLAFLSVLRLHKVQAAMNLRQVLEAGAAAAFAIANPEQHHFAETDAQGLLDPSQDLAKKRYQWLGRHYREKSDWIRSTKERINSSTAHANIVSSGSIFRIADTGDTINAPFFDIEDEYSVRADLWHTGSIALTLMDLFYGVNQGRNVLDFFDDFPVHIDRLARENNALLDEMKATDRFKRVMEKYGLPRT
jgi:hypothetical protein